MRLGQASIVLFSFASCAPLDRRPLFRTPAYVASHEGIDRAAQRAPRAFGEYRAGFGRVAIEVPEGVALAGYGDRNGAPHAGVRDPVFVRAFAIDAGGAGKGTEVLIFTADILLAPPNVSAAVRAALEPELDPQAIFFTASHTHSGPGGMISGLIWELVFGPYDERAFAAVVSAHVEAAKTALKTMRPARIGVAEVAAPGLIMNRVEKGGPTDDRLFVLAVEQTGGARAALWSYACHAVTLPAANLRISADYPGVVARAFEDQGWESIGYAAGGVGSSNPRIERPEDSTWLTDPLSRALAAGLERAVEAAQAEGSIAHAQLEVRAPPPRYRIARETMLLPEITRMVIDTKRAPLGAVAIGDTVMVFEPGELSGELTRAARADARREGITLAIFGFNGAYAGYVVPRRVYDLPDEKGEELLHYETHVMSFFGPWGGDLFMNLALRIAAGVRCAGAHSNGGGTSSGSGMLCASRLRSLER